jgi:hypothetical protein
VVTIFSPGTYAPKLNRKERPSLLHIPIALKRSFSLLGIQPIIQVLSVYNAIIFGTYYLFLTTVSSTFRNAYGQSIKISSLHYLAMLLGFILSVGVSGKAMDGLYNQLSKNGTFPEARMPYLAASGSILPAGLLLYGWTAQHRAFWLAPDVGLFLVGIGIMAPLIAIQHYILDC